MLRQGVANGEAATKFARMVVSKDVILQNVNTFYQPHKSAQTKSVFGAYLSENVAPFPPECTNVTNRDFCNLSEGLVRIAYPNIFGVSPIQHRYPTIG